MCLGNGRAVPPRPRDHSETIGLSFRGPVALALHLLLTVGRSTYPGRWDFGSSPDGRAGGRDGRAGPAKIDSMAHPLTVSSERSRVLLAA